MAHTSHDDPMRKQASERRNLTPQRESAWHDGRLKKQGSALNCVSFRRPAILASRKAVGKHERALLDAQCAWTNYVGLRGFLNGTRPRLTNVTSHQYFKPSSEIWLQGIIHNGCINFSLQIFSRVLPSTKCDSTNPRDISHWRAILPLGLSGDLRSSPLR
jgi:hypothetical protein